MRTRPDVLVFTLANVDEVLAVMARMVPREGWLTLQPGVDEDDVPATGASGGLFSGRGPAVPVCSWVPGERSRNGIDHTAIGLQHGAGPKVAERLAEVGIAVPERWEVMQDHPKRGLVVAVPPADAHDEVLGWLLRAGEAATRVPLTGEWRALAYWR